MQIRVPETISLKQGETRMFTFPSRYGDLQGFVIRYRDALHAYENKCLHWPIPLDFGDGEFYYEKIDRIVCKNHGAEYDPATGICDAGPCQGEALTRFPVILDGGDALVTVPEPE
jgi:nitrite reductase/ring-hydroxylating ferredoxin subunit